jgi:hypothetical protein
MHRGMGVRQSRNASSGEGALGNALLLLLALAMVLLAVAAAQSAGGKNTAALETEVQAKLHMIQVAVEQYGADRGGTYPPYLIGGGARYAATVHPESKVGTFTGIRDCDSPTGLSDPLLRRGYLTAYPSNPFIRDGGALHQVQENLPSSQSGDDPLRNGHPDGERQGTRFGPDCRLMGSVLADPRYRQWTGTDDAGTAARTTNSTWADIEYEFWDVWIGDKPLPYLPGEFFYKSAGPLLASQAEDSASGPVLPTRRVRYILGAYGSIYTKGKDVLGEEQPLFAYEKDPLQHGGNAVLSASLQVWPWTRSEVSTSAADREGSPYSAQGTDTQQIAYGNPNGIRDAITMVLTDGS